MKNILCLVVITCVILCFLSACTGSNYNVRYLIDETSIYQTSNKEVVDSSRYYCIYRENTTSMRYEIYNSNGAVVLSDITDKPLKIEMLDMNIVDISVGMGTGLAKHKYYSVDKNLFSEEFLYVLSNSNELVAYIDVPKEQPFENRKLVVQNIFDKDVFYREYQINFSRVDTPVIEAVFSEDGSSLHLTYLSGEDLTQISQIIKFNRTRGRFETTEKVGVLS